MPLTRMQQAQILLHNPAVHTCYMDEENAPGVIKLHTNAPIAKTALTLPDDVDQARVKLITAKQFEILPLNTRRPGVRNRFQGCQNEPIKLGTQIQPEDAPWVGTAGCAVAWTDPQGQDHWGILSNWHVFSMGRYDVGHAQHQPTDQRPPCAFLSAATPVRPDQPNTTDAAIADAMVNGYHSIDWENLELGQLGPTITPARVGQTFSKVGRTTGLTKGRCSAIGAGSRVNYGDFEAIFVDQDIFDDVAGSFSAAGDSGSCIVCDCDGGASSLLFAGGGNQTIGNPMQEVADKLGIRFTP